MSRGGGGVMKLTFLFRTVVLATFVFSISCSSFNKKADGRMSNRDVASGNPVQSHHEQFLKAAESGDVDYVKWQLKTWSFTGGLARVDINYQDQNGRTALMLASLNSHFDVVTAILNSRCEKRTTHRCAEKLDLNIQDNEGRTALMLALIGVFLPDPSLDSDITLRLGIVDYLLNRLNIDLQLRDNENRTVLAIATDLDNHVNHESHLRRQVHEMMVKRVLDTIKNRGIDLINLKDHQENTPLMSVARHGCFEIASLLLMHNADPNLTNSEGMTALQLAQKGGHGDVVELLTPRTFLE